MRSYLLFILFAVSDPILKTSAGAGRVSVEVVPPPSTCRLIPPTRRSRRGRLERRGEVDYRCLLVGSTYDVSKGLHGDFNEGRRDTILNHGKDLKDCFFPISSNVLLSEEMEGFNAYDFARDLSGKSGITSDVGAFSGSATAAVKAGHTIKSNLFYYKLLLHVSSGGTQFSPSCLRDPEIFNPIFLQNAARLKSDDVLPAATLNSKAWKAYYTFLDKFGSHYVSSQINGGHISVTTSAEMNDRNTASNLKANVTSRLAVFGATSKHDRSRNSSDVDANFDIRIEIHGGTTAADNLRKVFRTGGETDPDAVGAWNQQVREQGLPEKVLYSSLADPHIAALIHPNNATAQDFWMQNVENAIENRLRLAWEKHCPDGSWDEDNLECLTHHAGKLHGLPIIIKTRSDECLRYDDRAGTISATSIRALCDAFVIDPKEGHLFLSRRRHAGYVVFDRVGAPDMRLMNFERFGRPQLSRFRISASNNLVVNENHRTLYATLSEANNIEFTALDKGAAQSKSYQLFFEIAKGNGLFEWVPYLGGEVVSPYANSAGWDATTNSPTYIARMTRNGNTLVGKFGNLEGSKHVMSYLEGEHATTTDTFEYLAVYEPTALHWQPVPKGSEPRCPDTHDLLTAGTDPLSRPLYVSRTTNKTRSLDVEIGTAGPSVGDRGGMTYSAGRPRRTFDYEVLCVKKVRVPRFDGGGGGAPTSRNVHVCSKPMD